MSDLRKNTTQEQYPYIPTITIAKNLLGATLCRLEKNGSTTSGIIIETEAYCGEKDKACHAHKGKTPRTATMYGPPNYWYIYMIYGRYYCLNLVTQQEGQPEAVLIRALEPLEGIERMQRRRKTTNIANLCSGPGKLCQALGITSVLNGKQATRTSKLALVPRKIRSSQKIVATPRIGIPYAEEYQEKPWRFLLQ